MDSLAIWRRARSISRWPRSRASSRSARASASALPAVQTACASLGSTDRNWSIACRSAETVVSVCSIRLRPLLVCSFSSCRSAVNSSTRSMIPKSRAGAVWLPVRVRAEPVGRSRPRGCRAQPLAEPIENGFDVDLDRSW